MTSPAARNPITDVNSAEKAVASLESVMDRLELTVTEETARVRAGRLRDAAELDAATRHRWPFRWSRSCVAGPREA